ncbi:MAG: hypothetical protein A2096_08665 [Spirochaetes bacterium GWF1_41_5]|nr:MAG: hypothetical protein A2096_08665 [Spirochaetes bacterium GWF1_41_5]HBE01547.1 MBL fold metallo-hydrolase [Spirochaetia bacterium]
MQIKFFGVRGSIPVPATSLHIKEKLKQAEINIRSEKNTESQQSEYFPFISTHTFGGNTSSVYCQINDTHFCLDGGTGIRECGNYLLGCGSLQTHPVHIILSHTHWDHIQGIPFFVPIYFPGNKIIFHSCCPDIRKRLENQQLFEYFPVPFSSFGADVEVRQCNDTEKYEINGVKLSFNKLFHPGDSWACRLDFNGKSIVYTGDSEYNEKDSRQVANAIEFFRGADILIMDTMFSAEESWTKLDWGHSSANVCIDIGNRAEARKLIMFHYSPAYSDEMIYEQFIKAREYCAMVSRKNKMEIEAAWEGLEINL